MFNKNKKNKFLLILIIILLYLLINIYKINDKLWFLKISISSNLSVKDNKYWIGEKHKLIVAKKPEKCKETIYFTNLNNKISLINGSVLMNSTGRECLTAYIINESKLNSTICFNISNTPDIYFKESNPLRIETNNMKRLILETIDYPKTNIKYSSSHPELIRINNKGIITAIRPGESIISAHGLDSKGTKIKVIAVSNNGLISNYTLKENNAELYNNLMIVTHPDDEVLWGGANIYKYPYFIVCLTSGMNYFQRTNEFKQVLNFTNNSGIILTYPILKDHGVRDDWSEVRNGIINDLTLIFKYKNWVKIVTHGPDGTTRHIQHKKTSELVTLIARKLNKFNNLYYFGKFYNKRHIPKSLKRISAAELEIKIKLVNIYQSVLKTIHRYWFHFIPYENWILASKYNVT